jgi:aryl-alcohol dehydrogenase-like predicted oxidoreductase
MSNPTMDGLFNDDTLDAVERLQAIADDQGLTLVQLALSWILRRSEVASAIVGASRREQVHANAAASGIDLSADVLSAIDAALGDAPVFEPRLAVMARAGVLHR